MGIILQLSTQKWTHTLLSIFSFTDSAKALLYFILSLSSFFASLTNVEQLKLVSVFIK